MLSAFQPLVHTRKTIGTIVHQLACRKKITMLLLRLGLRCLYLDQLTYKINVVCERKYKRFLSFNTLKDFIQKFSTVIKSGHLLDFILLLIAIF